MPLEPKTQFKDPAAAVVWAGICALEEGAQHDVLEALTERLLAPEERRTDEQVRVARGIAALREAAKLLGGRSPSVSEYRRLREEHPERRWPPDGSVRGWLGAGKRWNEALLKAGLNAVSEPSGPAVGQGPNLTEEEILAAVRECAEDLGKPIAELSYSAYINWARQPEVRRRAGRRPASQGVFDKLGGWRRVKQVAIGGDPADAERLLVAAGADGHGYRYTDREIFSAAREILTRLDPGCAWPSSTEWMRERAAILAEERAAGKPPRALPTLKVIYTRFGSIANARHAYEQAEAERVKAAG